jgi:hypothetical protein
LEALVEEFLALLFQIFIELFVQLFVYLPFDWGLSAIWSEAKNETSGYEMNGCELLFLFIILGGLLGGLSLLVEPRLILRYAWMRITNLLATPVLAGALSWLIAEQRRRRRQDIVPGQHFWSAFWFGFAFSAVRFTFGTR